MTFDEAYPKMRMIAYRVAKPHRLIDGGDILSEMWIALNGRLGNIRPEWSSRRFLFAGYDALKKIYGRKKKVDCCSIEQLEEEPSVNATCPVYMCEWLKGLSPKDRELVSLSLRHHQIDIAKKLGVSQPYISRRLKEILVSI